MCLPNEEKIAEIDTAIQNKTDLIIGVGSGVINDLCKYVSSNRKLPYYIVAADPSMDGYASVGAALILEGMKITVNSHAPKAIIADTKILKDAPIDMIKAGYGDIIGKYSCLNDWKLSAIVKNEYFCQSIYDMTYEQAEKVKPIGKDLINRDETAVMILMEALVTIGLAMSYVDSSRPASGSEHHLSHYFEITGLLNNEKYYPHGIDVAFSSVVTAKIREKLINKAPVEQTFDENNWEKEINRIYKSSAEGVLTLQKKLGWYNEESSVIMSNPELISNILSEAPNADEFTKMLESVELYCDNFCEFYGEEKIRDAVLYAKDLKDRYSVLWLNFKYFNENI